MKLPAEDYALLGQHALGVAAAFSALSHAFLDLSHAFLDLSQALLALSHAAAFSDLAHAPSGQPAWAVSAAATRRNGMISVFITSGF